MSAESDARSAFKKRLAADEKNLIPLVQALLRIPSINPPGNTVAAAAFCLKQLDGIEGLRVARIEPKPDCINLNCIIDLGAPGPTLVFNGHLDTFPVGDEGTWTVPPLEGTLKDGRLLGRGVADMKSGVACEILAVRALAAARGQLGGRIVLSLVGDEETGGSFGTGYLVANVPEARGDAVLNADAGSPTVLRFGEKGYLWIELQAEGRASHGAHPHKGVSAIDALIRAITAIKTLEGPAPEVPAQVRAAVDAAGARAGADSGEIRNLTAVTVNVGVIEGGEAFNLVAGRALARLDVRIPAGLSVAEMQKRIAGRLTSVSGVSFTIMSSFEPAWTDPDHPIVRLALKNAAEASGEDVHLNYRLGYSDCRFYRRAGMPAILCGPNAHNLGGPDEAVAVEDVHRVFRTIAMTAYDYLKR